MRVLLARGVLGLMQGGEGGEGGERRAPPQACALALARMHTRVGGCGGLISIGRSGEVGVAFSTPRMAWAATRAGATRSGIDRPARAEGEETPIVEVVPAERLP